MSRVAKHCKSDWSMLQSGVRGFAESPKLKPSL